MKIYCIRCNKYMGEMTGTLRLNWSIVCKQCLDIYNHAEYTVRNTHAQTKKYDMPPGFEDLFKGFKG